METPRTLSRGELEQRGFEDITTLTQKFGHALMGGCDLMRKGTVSSIREGTKLAVVAAIVAAVLTPGCIEKKKFRWLWGDLTAQGDVSDTSSAGGDIILDSSSGDDLPDVIDAVEVLGPDDSQQEVDQQGIDANLQDLQDLVDAGVIDIPDVFVPDVQDVLKDLLPETVEETVTETVNPDTQPETVEEVVDPDVPPPDCDDNNPCTDDEFSEALQECVNTEIDCDDGIQCTADACKEGACFHFPNNELCPDNNVCTTDECVENEGCVHTYNSDPCLFLDDLCALESMCEEGLCVPVEWNDCDDGNECTNNFCNPATGDCEDINNEDSCDDADPCTTEDQCAESVCAGEPIICDDNETTCIDALCVPTVDCDQTQGYTFHIVGSGVNVVRLYKNGEIITKSSNTTMNELLPCDCGDTCVISVKKAGTSFFQITIEPNGSTVPVQMGASNTCVIDEFADGEVYTFTDIFAFIDHVTNYVVTHETDVSNFNECWTFIGPVAN